MILVLQRVADAGNAINENVWNGLMKVERKVLKLSNVQRDFRPLSREGVCKYV